MPERNPVRLSSPDPRITGPVRALPWADQALCAQTDPDLWYPEHGGVAYSTIDGDREQTAKSICKRCPVIAPCLDYALESRAVEGIWGGMSERERRIEAKRRAGEVA